jgi:hypothetical protein
MFLKSFATPILIENLKNTSRALNWELVDDILSEQASKEGETRSGVNVWQSAPTLDTQYESFKKLKHIITSYVHQFLSEIGARSINVNNFNVGGFWANVNSNPFAYHFPHIHGNGDTFISGIYYPSSGILYDQHLSLEEDLNADVKILSTNRPPPGSLVLHDPAEFVKTQVKPTGLQSYPYFGLPTVVVPREGVLVLFPNYIAHSVVPTEQKNFTRISIAFTVTF